MLSPFSGMDPYLEHPALWHDFHPRLTGHIGELLAPRLRPKYVARLETRVFAEIPDAEEIQILYPDIGVIERTREVTTTYDVAITPAPVVNVTIAPLRTKQVTIEIREVATHRLVTAIEVLSPANKRVGSAGYLEYRRKRARLLASDAHLLEIDLLRKGARFVSAVRPDQRPRVHPRAGGQRADVGHAGIADRWHSHFVARNIRQGKFRSSPTCLNF